MEREYCNSAEAAKRLGISRLTLYCWLYKSDSGDFLIRGKPFTIEYLQGGAAGQGRIKISSAEIDRLLEAMRVQPLPKERRRSHLRHDFFPHITVPLGRPD